jgi:linoleate 10R-lipoxygenase
MALLWCRNHNWIAEQLLIKSKDDARFAPVPRDDDKEALELLDEHLFQTARNINVGTFVTVVLKDYVRMLLGINRENTTWTLPTNQDFASSGKEIPKAMGNQCSITFNFIYRWHSAISQEDEKWIGRPFEDLEKRLGPDWVDERLARDYLPVFQPLFKDSTKSVHRRIPVAGATSP